VTRPRSAGVTGRTWPGAALALILLIGTAGSFGVGFGVLTDCTNAFSCTTTDCAPCSAAGRWLNAGWAGQAVLLVAGLALAVLARRGLRPRAVRTAALVLAGLSVALIVTTTALAGQSY
jgi:hypothetical protein